MKLLILFLSVSTIAFSSSQLLAQEVTLFNSDGDATAYIDSEDEDLTIYMWNGTPVAYLSPGDDEDFDLYGFNGKHLGWFEKGIIRDHEGDAVGFIEGATGVATNYEPYKDYKEYAPYKPYYSNEFSVEPLSLFLKRGQSK